MKSPKTRELIVWIDGYLADPRLTPEELLRKRWAWIWMVVTFLGVLATTIIFLAHWNAWPIAWSGFAFLFCYLVGFPLFRRLKRFDLVINIIFTLFIIMSFILLLQIGGFRTSLGFTLIGLNCAMGSVLAGNVRWTIGMFILYIITIILISLLQPYLATPDFITPEVSRFGFAFETIWISACILLLMLLFMKDQHRFQKAETDKIKILDEAKSQLYTNVSHEFRTPLTVIQGIADQLEKRPEKWLKIGPSKIKNQSRILLNLVNQMLDISRIEARSMPLNMIQGDIGKFVRQVTSSFQGLADLKKIKLEIDREKNPINADYDPQKLMQILSNLISNAIKFTPEGGKITVRVNETFEKKRETVNIHVIDSGKGIPNEALGQIFDRFYQVPDRNEQAPGTGLGLSLTRDLVKMMKGNIKVKSELMKGSEFIVSLPVTRVAPPETDEGLSAGFTGKASAMMPFSVRGDEDEINPAISPAKPILLIVEDNTDVLSYLVSILEDRFMVELARDGKSGLEKAQFIIPDLILTDVMMPRMDGFEMLRNLRNDIRTDHIPVVVLTARGDFPSKLSGLEMGADHFLVKPFSEKELLLKLNNLLDMRRKIKKKLNTASFKTHQTNSGKYRHQLKFLFRINQLLDAHLDDEDFGIKEICIHINMSRPQFYRKFSALSEKSIGQYIRTYRLRKAKEMMELQGKNVTEAAMDSGFKNLSHFSTIFREEYGYPPSNLK